MKYTSLTPVVLVCTVIITTGITSSCRKETRPLNVPDNHLSTIFQSDTRIRINQGLTFYDSTFIRDSIDFVAPPADKYYEWEVLPNNGCVSRVGDEHKGLGSFVFHCSGNYFITAKVYDSLSHTLIANTDTLEIEVTSDTLYPTQAIKPDDILIGRVSVVRSTWATGSEVYIQLLLNSTESYDSYSPYIKFDYTEDVSANTFSYTFSHVKLTAYPFRAGDYETTSSVDEGFSLRGLTYGVPANLSITWLNVVYTGAITLLNDHELLLNWDNSGAVKIQ